MPLLMVRNDIVNMKTDAIVNPANEDLLEGSGTSFAIYQAAGEALLEEACAKIGHCNLGEAVITDAFQLQADYIIHAVVPAWDDGYSEEESILASAYNKSLQLAKEKGCESIAFPLLSSGNLGFPKDVALKVALSSISEFLMEHEMQVYLVLYDSESVAVSEKVMGSIDAYIDDNYIEENDEMLDGDEMFSLWVREELEMRRANRAESDEKTMTFGDTAQLAPIMESASAPQPTCMAPSMAAPREKQTRSLDSLMKNLDETFACMLFRLIDERGLKDSDVYKKANVDRRHFSKIRNNVRYTPSKKTVIAFAIALELTMDETVDLMAKAGYAFSRASKFDVIISYFLENQSYDVFEINAVLFHYDQPTLDD